MKGGSAITDPAIVARILRHLRERGKADPFEQGRAPPAASGGRRSAGSRAAGARGGRRESARAVEGWGVCPLRDPRAEGEGSDTDRGWSSRVPQGGEGAGSGVPNRSEARGAAVGRVVWVASMEFPEISRFGRVALEAYRLAPALRLLAKPRASLLIADDVGLGKTIEAGLAMLELMARGRAERILIVTPPGLLDQWREELREKFGLEFTAIDNAAGLSRVRTELPAGTNPWDALPRVITSLDYLKKETVRHRALRRSWDLFIVDEAQALAESGTPENPYRTQRTRLGVALREAARGLLLLTATPDNGYSHSLRSLIELVEPTLATLAGSPEDVRRRIETARIRRMKAQTKRRLPDGREEDVFPQRTVRGVPVSALTEQEKELLRKVASYCARTAKGAAGTDEAELVGFAMQIVKKRALSSRAALAKTLEHRLEALRKEEAREEPPDRAELRDLQADLPLGEAAAERTARRILRSAIPREERRRKSEIGALNAIRKILSRLPASDPKLEALLAELRAVFQEDPAEKVIVFTEYRDTLDAIRARLDAEADLAGR